MRVVYPNQWGGNRLSSSKTPIDLEEAIETPSEQETDPNPQQQEFIAPTHEMLRRMAQETGNSSSSPKASEAARSFASLLNRGSCEE